MSVWNLGTITVTSGLTTISGYGTNWLSAAISAGNLIMKRGAGVAYTIAGTVSSDTILSINTIYPGPTESGLTYDIIKDFTVNSALPKPAGADRSDWPVIWADGLDKIDNWALGWNLTPFTCTYLTASGFVCAGDKTSIFTTDNRLKIVHAGGVTYHNIDTSSYGSPSTTVYFDGSGIASPISQVYHSILIPGVGGSMPSQATLSYIDFGSAPPVAGTYTKPFFRFSTTVVSGGILGWTLVQAGTPGIWHAAGIISEEPYVP